MNPARDYPPTTVIGTPISTVLVTPHGSGLPKTGTNSNVLIDGGFGLLGIGAGLVVIALRRKVRQ